MVKAAHNEQCNALYFNIHGDVGPEGANRHDDVELVRYGIKCLTLATNVADPAESPALGNQTAAAKEFTDAAKLVSMTGPRDARLGAAIPAYQKATGSTQDSTVSVIRSAHTPSGRAYVLQTMGANMRVAARDIFPRLDRVPETGPNLSNAVRRIFLGNG